MQTKQLHVRLTDEEMASLKTVAEQCEVNTTTLAAFFMRAAIRAVKAYGQRITLPPEFSIQTNVVERPRIEKHPPTTRR